MRYMLGVIHLANTPIIVKQSEWKNPKQRSKVVNDWITKSQFFSFDRSAIENFRSDLLSLMFNLKQLYSCIVLKDHKEDSDVKDDMEVIDQPPPDE
jgi:hypothetical protein